MRKQKNLGDLWRVPKSGFENVSVITRDNRVGGVWAKGYAGLRTQTPVYWYQFPDMAFEDLEPGREPKDGLH